MVSAGKLGKLLSTPCGAYNLTRQRRAVSTPADLIVNIQELVKTYPGKTPVEAVKGIDLYRCAGRTVRTARPEWRRQDHDH